MIIKKPHHLANLETLLQVHRYLLCVDLEATCDDYPPGMSDEQKAAHQLLVPRDEMETIEIGAVMIDLRAGCRVVGEFNRFVQPVLHPELTDFCRGLTTITQANVDGAQSYAVVAGEVATFLEPFMAEGWMWCSWGDYDAKQLQEDAQRAGVLPMLDIGLHTNLKKWFWKMFDCRALGLRPAVEALGLQWFGTYHRGIDDARNLAGLVWAITRASGPLPEARHNWMHSENARELSAMIMGLVNTQIMELCEQPFYDAALVQALEQLILKVRNEAWDLRSDDSLAVLVFQRRYGHKYWQYRSELASAADLFGGSNEHE